MCDECGYRVREIVSLSSNKFSCSLDGEFHDNAKYCPMENEDLIRLEIGMSHEEGKRSMNRFSEENKNV